MAERSGGGPLEWRIGGSTLPAISLEVWANPSPQIPGQRAPPSIEERGKVAADIMRREGFVIIRDAVSPEAVRMIRKEADALALRIIASDPEAVGNRGEARWSCSGSVEGSDATIALPSLLPSLGRIEVLQHLIHELA